MGALQMPYQTAFPPMQAAPFAFNGRDCAACPRLSSSPSAARRTTKCSAGGGEKPRISFGDRILDYIEGGPKLRRWYGASDQLPRDGTGGTADGGARHIVAHAMQQPLQGTRDNDDICDDWEAGVAAAAAGPAVVRPVPMQSQATGVPTQQQLTATTAIDSHNNSGSDNSSSSNSGSDNSSSSNSGSLSSSSSGAEGCPDPLLSALSSCASDADVASFHFPGHRRGLGAPASILSAFGERVFQHDLPELPELDNLFAPEGVLAEAQARAASLFGAAQSFFLVNGSTVGIHAAVMAACKEGHVLVLPRNAHQSAFAAMVLAGALPHYLTPAWDPVMGVSHGVTAQQVAAAVRAERGKGRSVGAVLIVSPTYFGVCSDVAAIAQECQLAGVPLIVDEAHGAHLPFLPPLPPLSLTDSDDCEDDQDEDEDDKAIDATRSRGSSNAALCTTTSSPPSPSPSPPHSFPSALSCGASLSIQSTHKVLPSLTQSAMLHVSPSSPIPPSSLARCLQLLQSSSPSYLLLASLDAAVGAISSPRFPLSLQRAARMAARLKQALAHVPGLSLLQPPTLSSIPAPPSESDARPGAPPAPVALPLTPAPAPAPAAASSAAMDPLRVTVCVRGLGMSGFEADDWLRERQGGGVVAELPFLHGLTFAFSAGNTQRDADALLQALTDLSREAGERERERERDGMHVILGSMGAHEGDCSDSSSILASCSGSNDVSYGKDSDLSSLLSTLLSSPPTLSLSPRRAFFSPSQAMPLSQAVGNISASLLCPYPPGIPCLFPGEVVSEAVVEFVRRVRQEGGTVTGLEAEEGSHELMLQVCVSEAQD